MNKCHWVLVAFVATMVCNGNCRPREVDVKNIYPVYRSEKQLELQTSSRYEKPHSKVSGDGSVSYHRIDIPYKSANGFNPPEELAVKNNSKSIIDYVPVALTIKKPNLKKWPSDQNGVESPDDLSLYNIYTNNINPLNSHYITTPGYNLDFYYASHSKPSILILEELTTTRKPFYDYESVYTQPIQVMDRPPAHSPPGYPTFHPPRPPEPPPPTHNPTELPSDHDQYFTTPQGYPPDSQTSLSTTSPAPLETTTIRKKNTKCPSVSITATTHVTNNNSMNKEGCQDIDIHINTDVSNSNSGFPPPDSPVVVVENDQATQPGVLGMFDAVWTLLSRIFSFSFLQPISGGVFSPFSNFFTGLSAFFFPWLFPHLLLQNFRRRKRIVFADNDSKPVKYLGRAVGESGFYLKREKRNSRRLQPTGWGSQKKISSSPVPTTETETKSENAGKSSEKINIESIATVARASHDGPPLPPPTSLGHVLDTVSQLMESDIRTPPKLKEIIREKATEHRRDGLGESSTPLPYTFIYDDGIGKFEEKHETTDSTLLLDSSEGKASNTNMKLSTDEGVKGIAIPVVMDDDYELTAPPKKLQKIPEVLKPGKDDKKKTGVTKVQSTTTPSSGLSTWILLSDNKEVTTPSPKKNSNKKEEEKKKVGVTTTTKKPSKTQATTQKTTTQTTKKVTAKPASKKPEAEATGLSGLEALVKSQKKGITTTPKPKTTETKKKVTDRLEVAETKDKAEVELPIHTLPPNLQVPSVVDKSVASTSSQSSSQTTTESSVEGTTKKKSTTKKKKKNKNRKKKPTDDTGVEAKIPPQPVGSQIYNFLSREIVPTVGLGLIGVALTAGLASFLGYNPFGSSTIPLRRTYDTHHGYSPNYYNYNTDYGDGGQSEEALFREVLSGMPEDSRYGLTHTDATYPEAYNRPDQSYDTVKNPAYPTATGPMYNSEKDVASYDAAYPQDYSTAYGTSYDVQDKKYPELKEKYPVYTRETGTSFVYPETTGMTSAEAASRISEDYATQSNPKKSPDTIERQPEALYRVASESELQYRNKESTVQGVSGQSSWHRIGSPMEAKKSYPMLEPGPRSLDLTKGDAKKRSKRAAESVIQRISRKRTKKANDVENEVDFEDPFSDSKFSEQSLSTSTSPTKTTTQTEAPTTSTTTTAPTTTEELRDASPTEPTDSYDVDSDSTVPPPSGVSVLDVLKRLAQFKLRLGLNFLRSTTDIFSRYLDDIQRRMDESFSNTTTTTVQYNRRKSPWTRIFFSRLNDDDDDDGSYRRKRSVLEENQFLGAMLTEDATSERFSKSTKKDLRLSNKIFHQKKTAPKKFESPRANQK